MRYFLAVGRYPVALARYDRLARTGFPLGDLEEAGDPIALYQLEHPDVLEDRSLCQLDTRGEQLLEELREEHELAL